MVYDDFRVELDALAAKSDLRTLPHIGHQGRWIVCGGRKMLNLSSNDYLGLAADNGLKDRFLNEVPERDMMFSASSSRLLTGNCTVYTELENMLAGSFGAESALVFGSGYLMNTGILPAVSDGRTLILADKLVHASLIDGIRLSHARCIRYRHQDYGQLSALLDKFHRDFSRIIVVTESVFSMDGDVAPLAYLAELKKRYGNVMLYVDEAHGVGVRGRHGLGVAEEQGCIEDIDFLCGTFGKALASAGAYVVCRKVLKDYLVNRMRTLIFTTALPPLNIAWTKFIVRRLDEWDDRREHLRAVSARIADAVRSCGYGCSSESHIIPVMAGSSEAAVSKAVHLQSQGFYVLPVRPPTVPEGTSRLRFSLTASVSDDEADALANALEAV